MVNKILPILILGAGGHARVVLDALRRSGAQIIGFSDVKNTIDNPLIHGLPIFPEQELASRFSPRDLRLVNGVGSIRENTARKRLFLRFRDLGYDFATLRHPAAIVADDVILRPGVQVMAGCVIQPGSAVGENSLLNTQCSVDHDCRIGAHVHIAPGAVLSGGVSVGDEAFIGAGSTVIQGIEIGPGAIIAAGAVVTANVKARTVVIGVPARGKND